VAVVAVGFDFPGEAALLMYQMFRSERLAAVVGLLGIR